MIKNDLLGDKVSLLGFGTMRLPTVSGEIDYEEAERIIDYAIAHGVNYFDTAYPYHKGKSEIVIGKILSKYPRESFFLANKYPGHQVMSEYDPAAIFEEQLQKCGVDYFDYYLLHNVNEKSIETYRSEKWGIVDYFLEQKKLGRIKHLGFSTHARPDCLREFLDEYGEHMDFCQIQLNYLDWTLQRADEKYNMLTERGIPVFVMEPVRGGKLANLAEAVKDGLSQLRPGASDASFAFRWLMGLPGVKVILSGMTTMEQVVDNVKTFEAPIPLTPEEEKYLLEVAEGMKKSVPCTQCKYCVDGCPMGLDIPLFMATYNELSYEKGVNAAIPIQYLPTEKMPNACITCQRCSRSCPQNIDIPLVIAKLIKLLDDVPSWDAICREREEAAKKAKIK